MNELTSILSQETKITTKFTQTIELKTPEPLLIQANKKTILPIYLTKFFIKNNHCTYDEIIKPDLKKEFNAKASCVDLGNSYFYENILELDENREYAKNVFLERMKDFLDLVIMNDVTEDDFCKLDEVEKSIVREARCRFHLFNK